MMSKEENKLREFVKVNFTPTGNTFSGFFNWENNLVFYKKISNNNYYIISEENPDSNLSQFHLFKIIADTEAEMFSKKDSEIENVLFNISLLELKEILNS